MELGMIVHTYNPGTQELKQENFKFKASLGYIASSSLVQET
jgi:hypothetical protein